ncbi:MAG: TolC family protein [bacterium]|nr:TolC family protein [bacterium]
MRIKIIAILFLSAGMICWGKTVTLAECIHRGIANNLSVENARIDINKSRTGITQNRSRLLPVINGIFQFTDYLKQPVNVTTGTLLGNDFPENPTWQTIRSMQYNVNAGVQLNVPLYNQSIYASIDVAETVEHLGRLSYDKAVEDLTMQIGKVYYLAQSSLEQTVLADENIARMQELCGITEAMYEQGVVLEVDLNRARINLQNLKAQRDQFSMLYEQQINMLRFLLDLAPEDRIEVERMPRDIVRINISGISHALPELRMVTMQKELIDRKITAIKAGYIPTISLTGYAGALGYQDKFNHFFHTKASSQNWFGNCFIGLNVSIPIFDAGSKKLQIRQHRYDAEQAINRAEILQNKIRTDYSNALRQLDHNIEVFQTQSQSYRLACDVFKVTEEQYREGVSSMTAILQDEMQLRTAQSARTQAHCLFNLAQLELLRLSDNLSALSNCSK